MSEDGPGADREEPVGAPVVRGDPEIVGAHAEEAVEFDPDDPESLATAAELVCAFADGADGGDDHLYMLRGAAACAALVRGEGSYKAAAERADVSVGFLRKWARVHDLPISIRRYIAMGEIAPSAAKHIARVPGDTRFILAWAVLDNDLTVEDVRLIASDVGDGVPIEDALERRGVRPGELTVELPLVTYRELRRAASLERADAETVVAEALDAWLAER